MKAYSSLGTETAVTVNPNICICGSIPGLRMKHRGRVKHTFGLDFLTLVEGEVWGQEFRTVRVGH